MLLKEIQNCTLELKRETKALWGWSWEVSRGQLQWRLLQVIPWGCSCPGKTNGRKERRWKYVEKNPMRVDKKHYHFIDWSFYNWNILEVKLISTVKLIYWWNSFLGLVKMQLWGECVISKRVLCFYQMWLSNRTFFFFMSLSVLVFMCVDSFAA